MPKTESKMTRKKQQLAAAAVGDGREIFMPEKTKIILHSSSKNELVIRKRDWQSEEIVRGREGGEGWKKRCDICYVYAVPNFHYLYVF